MAGNRLSELIDDRPEAGVFRVSRAIFDDPGAVRPRNGAHLRRRLGVPRHRRRRRRRRTISSRPRSAGCRCWSAATPSGTLGAFVNSCLHKGSRLAQTQSGNARLHVCPYHSWSYDSAGRNKGIKLHKAGCYAEAFDAPGTRSRPAPRLRANIAASCSAASAPTCPRSPSISTRRAKLLDLVADQSEQGFELVPGGVTFTFAGNWKLQLENCSDAYHFTSAHPSYIRPGRAEAEIEHPGGGPVGLGAAAITGRKTPRATSRAAASASTMAMCSTGGFSASPTRCRSTRAPSGWRSVTARRSATGCSTCATSPSSPICRSRRTRRASCA